MGTLGLRMSDLFSGPPKRTSAKPTIAAAYDYTDLSGSRLAQKVRLFPKSFRWRVPVPGDPSRWRWNLDGVTVGLYNLSALMRASQVLVTEGERAVDRLSALDFAATCPPAGASKWDDQWSALLCELGCAEVVVLADADRAGQRHAERVALSCFSLADRHRRLYLRPGAQTPGDVRQLERTDDRGPQVKLVALRGLPAGGDVVDFLEAGGTAADLRAVIDATPAWSPDLDQRLRAERRRAAACVRQRRRRQRLRAEREAVSRCVCQASG